MRFLCLLSAVLIVVGLFVLGEAPGAGRLFLPPWDKLAHISVYGVLTLLLWIATGGRMPLGVVAAVLMVGVLDELHQAAIPGRTADLADLFADAGGVSVALLLIHVRKLAPKGNP